MHCATMIACAGWVTRAVFTASTLTAAIAGPAFAFDTGHHFDLLDEVMRDGGFSAHAVRVAQVENWLVDYYSARPTASAALGREAGRLHFDNLFSNNQVRNYWNRLAYNTRREVQTAAKANDPLRLLAVLGASSHAVQDFYSHSNWVETHPANGTAFRTETWFDGPVQDTVPIFTGSWPNLRPGATALHGGYTAGLNHDAYGRPRWDEAYVFAYAATRQWVNAIHQWINDVNPDAWTAAQHYSLTGSDLKALDGDYTAAYRLSEWVSLQGADGHWKGKGSGSTADFATAAKWIPRPDSQFVREAKLRVLGNISEGLSDDGGEIAAPPETAPVPRVPLDARAIIVRTLKVRESPVGLLELKIDPGGKADFYAKITIAGQAFVEATQVDKSGVSPAWTTIRFVPADMTAIPVRYELWDEDGGARGGDDHCDINPAKGKRDLDMRFSPATHELSGDVSGVHDNGDSAITLAGAKPDSNRAVVTFIVTERLLVAEP